MWDGETAVVVATGPSLARADVEYCRGKCRVAVVNTSIQLAPWADLLYFADMKWFEHHRKEVLQFSGLKVTIENSAAAADQDPAVKVVRNKGDKPGPCLDPRGVHTGRNSGYQLLNVLMHAGIRRMILLGFDCRAVKGKLWWFGEYGWASSTAGTLKNTFVPKFRTLAEPFRKMGIEVVNATPGSALDCWPMMDLRDALCTTRLADAG
jgi:hypothetical protein